MFVLLDIRLVSFSFFMEVLYKEVSLIQSLLYKEMSLIQSVLYKRGVPY